MIQEPQEIDPIQGELLNNHTHVLQGEINVENVGKAISWIIAENMKKVNEDEVITLNLYINSTGGDLYSAFALIDVMHASKYPIRTIGMGAVMSAAALILSCGKIGQRFIAPHSGILIHQFFSDMEGKEHELKASMRELELCRQRMHNLFRDHCKISEKVITKKLLQPTDLWITAQEAIKYKLADKLFTKL